MKNRIVHYSKTDLNKALEIASKRNNPKVKSNVHSKKFDPRKSELQAHQEGILGELAFSIYSGLPVRTDISLAGEKPKGKWDFTLPTGKTVEVRYRTKRWHEFALNTDRSSDFVTDYGVLVIPGEDKDTLEIRGCIRKETFLEKSEVAVFRGRRLKVSNDNLEPMDLIDDELNL
jgi:hypothetical protein